MKKRNFLGKILALALVVSMLASFMLPAFAAENEEDAKGLEFELVDNSLIKDSPLSAEAAKVEGETSQYSDTDNVRVSIVLDGQSTLEAGFSTSDILNNASALKHMNKVKGNQKNMEAKIAKAIGKNLNVKWNLTLAANIISANVAFGDVNTIAAVDGVRSVIVETRYAPAATVSSANPNMAISSTNMTGTVKAWADGYTGAGARIAIIDTGLDIDHQSFDNDAFLYSLEQNAKAAGKKLTPYLNSVNLLSTKEVGKALPYLNATALTGGSLTADALRISDKIPYGFNYVDRNTNVVHVNDSQGEHGSHVSGIAAANRYIPTEEGFVDALSAVCVAGNAPDAQVLVMKVFGQGGGAYDSDYMAAIEDAILLGCDSVNLSLGSSAAGMTTSTTYQAILDKLSSSNTVVVMSAGNSGAWADETSYGELYADDVNFMTAGSPGTYANAFTVASVNNDGMVGTSIQVAGKNYGYSDSPSYGNAPLTTLANGSSADYEYVFLDGFGEASDFDGIDVDGKVVFCSRGAISFFEKANNAVANGAIATIIYNNTTGVIGLNLTGYLYKAPCVSIAQDAAAAIKAASTKAEDGEYWTGTVTINNKVTAMAENAANFTMSSFSSWGVPGNLSLKPEITAPGGSIYSVAGTHNAGGGVDQYELMSGTSMAAPQVTGMTAVLKRYIEMNGLNKSKLTDRALAQSLLMSTATAMVAPAGYTYSPMQQGAGLANVSNAMKAASYILMGSNATASAADGKVKAELGDDPAKTGVYSFSFTMNALGKKSETYALSANVFTQASDGDFTYGATAPIAANVSFTVNGAPASSVTVKKNSSVTVTTTIALTDAAKEALNETYPDGAYVEAFVYAKAQGTSASHSIPVLAFYGNWTDSSMFDKGSYMDYKYGLEQRVPYLYANNKTSGNAFTIAFAGESAEYYYGGNMYATENTYDPTRNALNNQNGDAIASVSYALIRNAGARAVVVSDAETGEIYMVNVLPSQQAAYYYANGGAWRSTKSSVRLGWKGTDGAGEPLPEGTTVNLSLVALPEYYGAADGTYNLSAAGEGAYLSTMVTIDNTAPVVEAVADDETGSILVSAADNENIAAILLYAADGEKLVGRAAVGAPSIAAALGSDLDADIYLLHVIDYAGNAATYRVFMKTEVSETVESVSVNPQSLVMIKNNTAKLTATVQPATLADRTVTWTSSDEEVATVNADGVVTAVGAGSCEITAAATLDPEMTATCTVSVTEINTTLNGVVWDEEGEVWMSSFATNDLPNYTKLTESSWNAPVNSLAFGADGTLYATDLDTEAGVSNLYTVDGSFNLNMVGTSSIGYTEMAEAPHLGGALLGTYFNYIVLIDPTTGDYMGAFDYAANDLVGITYAGSMLNTNYNAYMDFYYLMDAVGNVYFEAFINLDGSYYYFMGADEAVILSTGITCDTPYFQSLYFDGTYTYYSCFNEGNNCVTLYAIDTEVTGAVFRLGTFADGVWPVAGLSQVAVSDATAAAGAKLAEAEYAADVAMVTPELHALSVGK